MFARVLALLPLVLLVVACDPHCPLNGIENMPQDLPKDTPKDTPQTTPTPPETGNTTVNQCNTGGISCCNQVQTIDQCTEILESHNLLEIAGSLGGLVGLDCGPIDVLGVGSGCQATQQPVCCQNNQFNGLVNVGCSPIAVKL